MKSFHRALVGFNNLESILFIYSLIVGLCLKYKVCPYKWRVELSVWEIAFFPVPREVVYSFFNFLFDIFWNSINLTWRRRFGLRLPFYLPKRVSFCSRYGFFVLVDQFCFYMHQPIKVWLFEKIIFEL